MFCRILKEGGGGGEQYWKNIEVSQAKQRRNDKQVHIYQTRWQVQNRRHWDGVYERKDGGGNMKLGMEMWCCKSLNNVERVCQQNASVDRLSSDSSAVIKYKVRVDVFPNSVCLSVRPVPSPGLSRTVHVRFIKMAPFFNSHRFPFFFYPGNRGTVWFHLFERGENNSFKMSSISIFFPYLKLVRKLWSMFSTFYNYHNFTIPHYYILQ